jgi:hypothetical protein
MLARFAPLAYGERLGMRRDAMHSEAVSESKLR